MADRAASNRANARTSTGPRTTAGKARASRNARRHGLSLPAVVDPSLSQEIKALAGKITGRDDSTDRRELAIAIAAAQIELMRVRQARHQMLALALSDPDYHNPTNAKFLRERGLAHRGPVPTEAPRRSDHKGIRDPGKIANVLADLSMGLLALDRYERRALSRRRRAIRNFDALGNGST